MLIKTREHRYTALRTYPRHSEHDVHGGRRGSEVHFRSRARPVIMRAAPRVAVGESWVDPRDVAGITRGVGPKALTLTVHTFPAKRALWRRRRREGGTRVDREVSFETVVDLIAARDRLVGECFPANSLWLDPANDAAKVMVVVNPAAGNGGGKRVYERDVEPVLRCALGEMDGHRSASRRLDVVVTESRGDAHAAASRLDLDAYAAVVCVGGDGTLAEVRNGLAGRADKRDAARAAALPVGVVPAGSGNAVAKSLAFFANEPCDAASAALAVARGGTMAMDAADVFVPSGSSGSSEAFDPLDPRDDPREDEHPRNIAMRSLLSLSWGLFADIDVESERFRWLGGARFTAQAIVRILFPRKYRGAKLRFKPLEDVASDAKTSANTKKTDHSSSVVAAARRAATRGSGSEVSVPVTDDPHLAKHGWKELREDLRGDIRGVWALNVPWGAEDMHAAPAAEPSDGAYDVLVIRGASRLAMLGLLLTFDAGGHVDHPAVTYLKCSAFELTPGRSDGNGGGYVAVDGELVAAARDELARESEKKTDHPPGSPATWRVPYGPTRVRVRAGGARVFAAGGAAAAEAA